MSIVLSFGFWVLGFEFCVERSGNRGHRATSELNPRESVTMSCVRKTQNSNSKRKTQNASPFPTAATRCGTRPVYQFARKYGRRNNRVVLGAGSRAGALGD